MSEMLTIPAIPPESAEQFREAMDDLMKGNRRPEKIKAACERMDRMREENRKLFGMQNIAVQLIRETRDRARNTSWIPAWR